METDATIKRQYMAGARAVGALGALLTLGQLDGTTQGTRDSVQSIIDQWEGRVPEPENCRDKEHCAGLRRCPRDPVCNE